MTKKILCWVVAFTIFFPASMLRADDSGSGGKPVKLIMKDGSIIQGDMLGLDNGTLTLQTKEGKAKDVPVGNIKKAFDADGNSVPLNGQEEAAPAPRRSQVGDDATDDSEPEARVPRRRVRERRRERAAGNGGRGLKVTGIILDIVGGVGFGVGLYMDIDGSNNQTNALHTYTTSEGYANDGNYYYEYVNGKYYTYDEYYAYTAAQYEQGTGVVVAVVGGALLITGIVLGAVGSAKSNQASLMHVEDQQLAWGVPMMNYDSSTHESRLTLLDAKF